MKATCKYPNFQHFVAEWRVKCSWFYIFQCYRADGQTCWAMRLEIKHVSPNMGLNQTKVYSEVFYHSTIQPPLRCVDLSGTLFFFSSLCFRYPLYTNVCIDIASCEGHHRREYESWYQSWYQSSYCSYCPVGHSDMVA